jgi:hypothetical protein
MGALTNGAASCTAMSIACLKIEAGKSLADVSSAGLSVFADWLKLGK